MNKITKQKLIQGICLIFILLLINHSSIAENMNKIVFKAGHPSLQKWLLAEKPPEPADNKWTQARSDLGKMLFFDPRLSGNGTISCASCHNPMLGWSDGLVKAIGINGSRLGRASPVVTNTAYNYLQMWDGRKKDLEDQVTAPMEATAEMHTDFEATIHFLNHNKGYKKAFSQAYPGEKISQKTIAKAIASFERTIISNNSPFDRWLKGDKNAMTAQQINGFKLFVDPNKGNCEICHSAPNFVDDGFHNIGVKGDDVGRYALLKVKVLKGAFKTPTLRDISLSAPYFHNGTAKTLKEVMEHYNRGGDNKENLDPNIHPLNLSEQEMDDIVAFMQALTMPPKPFTLPVLPLE